MDSLNLASALEGLYEAAATPEEWPNALHNLARAAGAVGCRLRPIKMGPEDVAFPTSAGVLEFYEDFICSGWQPRDPRTLIGAPLVMAGRPVVLEYDIWTDDERRRSPFYQELLRRHDLPWWTAVAFETGERRWCMSILRNSAQGAFTPTEAESLVRAAPHVGRMASLASKLALAKGRSATAALERIGRAAFLLDFRGKVVMANALADERLGGDLKTVHGRLRAADAKGDRRLASLIDCCVLPRNSAKSALEPVFIGGKLPSMVEGWPATGWMKDVFGRIAALIVITDLAVRPRPAEALIREAFRLSAAEAKLAAALANGDELQAAAQRVGVTYETARAYLKSIFAKANVNRQSELVSLLSRLPVAAKPLE